LLKTTTAKELQEEWLCFLAEPWGDEWRTSAATMATLVSIHCGASEAKHFSADQILTEMIRQWKQGVRSPSEIESENMQQAMNTSIRQQGRARG